MKLKFSFLIIILLLSFQQSISAQTNESESEDDTQIVSVGGSAEGKRYFSNVTRGDVKNTPSWDLLSGKNPPLSVKDAIGAAQDSLKQIVKDLSDWEVTDIRLIPQVKSEKWVYIIEFRSKMEKSNDLDGQFFRLIVKMDGVAVKPELLVSETENLGIPNSPKN